MLTTFDLNPLFDALPDHNSPKFQALKNLPASPLCWRGLYEVICLLREHEYVFDKNRAKKPAQDLLDAIVSFLGSPMSDEVLLQACLKNAYGPPCKCLDKYDVDSIEVTFIETFHSSLDDDEDQPLTYHYPLFLESLYDLIAIVIQQVDHNKPISGHGSVATKKWPCGNVGRLLPHGAENLLKAALQRFHHLDNRLHSFNHVALILALMPWPADLKPALNAIQGDIAPLITSEFISFVKAYCSEKKDNMQHDVSLKHWSTIIANFALDDILTPHAQPLYTAFLRITKSMATKLKGLDGLILMVRGIETASSQFKSAAIKLWMNISEKQPLDPHLRSLVESVAGLNQNTSTNGGGVGFLPLLYATMIYRPECNNPECPLKERKDTVFKNCTQCKLMRYCGPQCQKAAWKHPIVPHKTICVKMGQIYKVKTDIIKLNDDISPNQVESSQDFVEAIKKDGLAEMAREVMDHFQMLNEVGADLLRRREEGI
ncbi:hypothetical protein DL96DRAFT_1616048 [Flagelloscypha sp. PMI_526]|nr:hypothetical protein DL96DRAFT_1616048 [Flagelloscypha sp. PMI_526]